MNLSTFGYLTASSGFTFTQSITATGAPISWTLLGSYPSGITLSNAGVLNGIIATPGTYFINYKVTNAYGFTIYPLTMTIT